MLKKPSIEIHENRKTGELIANFINQEPKVTFEDCTLAPMRNPPDRHRFILGFAIGFLYIFFGYGIFICSDALVFYTFISILVLTLVAIKK